MKLKAIKLLAILLMFRCTVFAQHNANNWYFGLGAGISFSNNIVSSSNNGQTTTGGASAAISDNTGQLLFYSDGQTVWDKNHAVMTNGTGLLGRVHNDSYDKVLIIKKPGNNLIYYIFTTDEIMSPNTTSTVGVRYSEVDMSLSAGLGAINSNKNIQLFNHTSARITAIKHCNNTDIWVLTHDYDSNNFRSFLVTPSGINNIPVISSSGMTFTNIQTNGPPICERTLPFGQMKANIDGTKIGCSNLMGTYCWNIGQPLPSICFEIHDFNRSTGVVSNPLPLTLPWTNFTFPESWGCEFSPDGKLFYGTTGNFAAQVPRQIWQWNLCAGTGSAAINASSVCVGNSSSLLIGGMQLAPDGKIYVARRMGSNFLGVINSPNQSGLASNYVDNGFQLNSGTITQALCNFPSYFLKNSLSSFTFSYTSACTSVSFSPLNLNSCINTGNATYTWDFGDTNSPLNSSNITNPTHQYTSNGNYTVTLIVQWPCNSDTIKKIVSINSPSLTIALPGNLTCLTPSLTLIANYTSSNTINWVWLGPAILNGSNTANPTINQPGTYSVTASSAGCVKSQTVIVTSNFQNPNLNVIQNATLGCNPKSCILSANSNFTNVTFIWAGANILSSANAPTIIVGSSGTYTASVVQGVCITSKTVSVIDNPNVPTVNIVGINYLLCPNKEVVLNASSSSSNAGYQWSNGSNTNTISISQPGLYNLTIKDLLSLCSNTSQIFIKDSVDFYINVPKKIICEGECVIFTSSRNGIVYNWNFGNGFTSTNQSPKVCYNKTGKYDLSLRLLDSYGCSAAYNSINAIEVIPKPISNFNFHTQNDTETESLVKFENLSANANQYQWYQNNSLLSNEFSPSYVFENPSSFFVTLIAVNNKCNDTMTKLVSLEDPFIIYVPNSFTPNSDGQNDTFYPVISGEIKSYLFTVYNSWGELVFKSNNPNETQWNGYFKNEPCKDDVYVWKINVTNNKGKALHKTGHVTLMK